MDLLSTEGDDDHMLKEHEDCGNPRMIAANSYML